MGKTAYERYIEANNNLAKCFQAVSVSQYQSFSAQQKNELCAAERDAVRSFLASNQVGFANLIKERLESAGH